MTVYILNSLIKKRDYDGVVLNEKDFHPCHPFFVEHPDIKPESIDHIVIKGIFERCKYKRAVLRYCDYMLSKGGILEIFFYNIHFENSLYVRSRNDWQYELSLVFGERVLLIEQQKDNEKGYFKYKKNMLFLPSNDTMNRWTFGIVSSGRMNEKVMRMICQIENLNIPEYEILVCGPSPSDNLPSHVRVLDDRHLYPDLRVPISKKKNYIIDESKYNNLVMMHDRYSIPEHWYVNMKNYGNYFDILVCNVYNEDYLDLRMQDWFWHYPNPFPNSLKNVLFPHPTQIDKNYWDDNIYIPGGFFIFKKHLGITLNPELNWGEKEDVDFCRRAYINGLLIEFDPNNSVFCTVVRFDVKGQNMSVIRKTCGIIKKKIVSFFSYYKEKKEFDDYLQLPFDN